MRKIKNKGDNNLIKAFGAGIIIYFFLLFKHIKDKEGSKRDITILMEDENGNLAAMEMLYPEFWGMNWSCFQERCDKKL